MKGMVWATVWGLALAFNAAAAQEVVLKAHHFLPPTSVTHAKLIKPWAEKVEADSGGRIKVEIYPAMQLGGKPPQLYDQVRDGVADVVWTLPGYTAGRFPVAGVFELPFMVSTAEATSQAIQAFSEKHLRDEFADVHPLLFHVHGRGSFHLRTGPIERIEDLAGLKIRAPSRAIGDALTALGAAPIFMPVPAVPQSLSRGVVDGAMLPFEVTLPLRAHEMVSHHTEIGGDRGLYTAVFLLAMNKARYDGLPADLQQVIDASAGMDLAKHIGRVWDEAEAPGRQKALDRGNAINVLAVAEVARMKTATQPVIDAWVVDVDDRGLDGQSLLNHARDLIVQYSK